MTDTKPFAVDEPTLVVDLGALERNARRLAARLPKGVHVLAAVKADGYGHGAVQVSRALAQAGVRWFGVATASEAHELRDAGITGRILVFGPVPGRAAADLVRRDVDLMVGDVRGLRDLEEALASSSGNAVGDRHGVGASTPVARVHLKVDTGMGRLGRPSEEALHVAQAIEASTSVRLEGTWTHFACADDPRSPDTDAAVIRFRRALDELVSSGSRPGIRHASNSAAVLTRPDAAFDMVRPGIALYGHAPSPELAAQSRDLEPVGTLLAPATFVKRVSEGTPVSYGGRYVARRETTIVTIRLGYADGYPRAATNVGRATWSPRGRGARVRAGSAAPMKVAGTVCMDQTMFDAGDADVQPGDGVCLWGAGGPNLTDLASAVGTISYELLVRTSTRVARAYVRSDPPIDAP